MIREWRGFCGFPKIVFLSLRQRANEAEDQRQRRILKTDELQNRLNSPFHQALHSICWGKVVLPLRAGMEVFCRCQRTLKLTELPALTKAAFLPILMRRVLSGSKTLQVHRLVTLQGDVLVAHPISAHWLQTHKESETAIRPYETKVRPGKKKLTWQKHYGRDYGREEFRKCRQKKKIILDWIKFILQVSSPKLLDSVC